MSGSACTACGPRCSTRRPRRSGCRCAWRASRERLLAPLPLRPAFPLWGEDTRALARRFVALGFRAVLVCVDPRQIDPAFCGREFDESLLAELPSSADPCGENGEFHTFVYAGPIFR